MEVLTAGKLLLLAVLTAYTYYSFWVLATPFIDADQPILRLFPDRYFALAVPVLAGVLLWSATLITLGCFLISSEVSKWRRGGKLKLS